MPMHICDRCKQSFSVPFYVTDYVHECNSGSDSLDNEDVPVVGNYTDEDTGSSVVVSSPMLQGSVNKLYGSKSWVEGNDVEDTTARGNRVSTHRQRKHYNYISLKR